MVGQTAQKKDSGHDGALFFSRGRVTETLGRPDSFLSILKGPFQVAPGLGSRPPEVSGFALK